ncbi:MAG: hypothetical protein Ct9H300mP1_08560 [Planctomycetaceae bacterium]|nr:MAG: hypothetical protein Ct9H300mP1_08560 [Planctomycetaceae bacterium]
MPERPQAEIPTGMFTDITDEAGINSSTKRGLRRKLLLRRWVEAVHSWTSTATVTRTAAGQFTPLGLGHTSQTHPASPPGPLRQRRNGPLHRCHQATRPGRVAFGWEPPWRFRQRRAPDLFLSAVGHNRLFRNTGERFEDVTKAAGVAGKAPRGVPAADSSTPMPTEISTCLSATMSAGARTSISPRTSRSTASSVPTANPEVPRQPPPISTSTMVTELSPTPPPGPASRPGNASTNVPLAKSLGWPSPT